MCNKGYVHLKITEDRWIKMQSKINYDSISVVQ